jgi:inosose dehydratase
MSPNLTRREVLSAAVGLVAGSAFAAAEPNADITVGITSNTRPDWTDDFQLSLRECSEVGYHWIETFWNYVTPWEQRPEELVELLAGLNLKMETVSNGGGMNTSFQSPGQRKHVIEDHMRLVRFLKKLGCDHLKINCGQQSPGGNTPETYREMAKTFNELGQRISDEGIQFGIHHHLWTQYEKRHDVDAIMDLTDPRYVHMILDTGHTTMAGMDALQLAKDYGPRILEFHLKDVEPANRSGYQGPALDRRNANTTADNRIFFELGKGGVDFPGILAHLNSIGWKGWFTVELDRTGSTAKESAAISKKYIENVLKLKV